MTNHDPLRALTDWYAAQCDGNWEHGAGISIDSLDNPGWRLSIDIAGTTLRDVSFKMIEYQIENNESWWVCKCDGNIFDAIRGPHDLQSVIYIFIDWANSRGRASQ